MGLFSRECDMCSTVESLFAELTKSLDKLDELDKKLDSAIKADDRQRKEESDYYERIFEDAEREERLIIKELDHLIDCRRGVGAELPCIARIPMGIFPKKWKARHVNAYNSSYGQIILIPDPYSTCIRFDKMENEPTWVEIPACGKFVVTVENGSILKIEEESK